MGEVQANSDGTDPRIRRTRQMLFEALGHLLQSRVIEQISVADIAEQATLNRATFYDHYPDKFALLKGLVEARFHELISNQKVVFDGSCAGALMGITQATCDFLASLHCASQGQLDKHLEIAIGSVLRGIILGGLKNHPPESAIPIEIIAATISGGIYGGSREWVRTPDRMPLDHAVRCIFALVGPILRPVDQFAEMPHLALQASPIQL